MISAAARAFLERVMMAEGDTQGRCNLLQRATPFAVSVGPRAPVDPGAVQPPHAAQRLKSVPPIQAATQLVNQVGDGRLALHRSLVDPVDFHVPRVEPALRIDDREPLVRDILPSTP